MNLNNISPFSEYYFNNDFNYTNIKNRESFLKSVENVFTKDIIEKARSEFHDMNTQLIKQIVQRKFSIGESMSYMFCLIPYSPEININYYINALKKIFYHGFKNNIEIEYCLISINKPGYNLSEEGRDPTTDEKYKELKDFISSELFLEKQFTLSSVNAILQYIKFCSMFDSFIIIDNDLIYWSWYLSSNWDCCKIISPSCLQNKFRNINLIEFIDV
jgi:hypothetical protein